MVGNLMRPIVVAVFCTTIFVCGSAASNEGGNVFILTPSNVASVVNSTVTMNCSSKTHAISWVHLYVNGSTKGQIWNGRRLKSNRYGIILNNDTGEADLIIKQVEMEDAGLYKCLTESNQFTAQLIVLESPPVCGINTTHVWCQINYDGNGWTPQMRWLLEQQPNETISKINELLIVATETSNSVRNEIPLKCFSGCIVQSITYFLSANRDKLRQARNIPDLKFNWTSSNISKTRESTDCSTTAVAVNESLHERITEVYEYLSNWTSQHAVVLSMTTNTRPTKPVLDDAFFLSLRARFPQIPEETLYAVLFSFFEQFAAQKKVKCHCSVADCKRLLFSSVCKAGKFDDLPFS